MRIEKSDFKLIMVFAIIFFPIIFGGIRACQDQTRDYTVYIDQLDSTIVLPLKGEVGGIAKDKSGETSFQLGGVSFSYQSLFVKNDTLRHVVFGKTYDRKSSLAAYKKVKSLIKPHATKEHNSSNDIRLMIRRCFELDSWVLQCAFYSPGYRPTIVPSSDYDEYEDYDRFRPQYDPQ